MLFDLVSSLEDKEYVDVDVVVDVIVIGEASSLQLMDLDLIEVV